MNTSMPVHGFTPKQKKVLDYIVSYAAQHGYVPTQREIADHFRFSSLGTVQNYLVRLERQGHIAKAWNGKRAMQVLRHRSIKPETVQLPLVGTVAAGKPIEAVESFETVDVPSTLLKKGEHIALRVRGDSMMGSGILDGDTVIIKKQASAEKGQTVVALVKNEATIKQYFSSGKGRQKRIELRATNPKYAPMVIEGGEFKIEGVLVGVIRSYS